MSPYARRIRELRIHHGLSQEQLAEKINVSQNQISRYERGLNDPTGDVLIALSEVLNTSTDYLLGKTNDPTPYGQNDGLAPDERKALAAWRRGDKMEAMRIIMNG